MPQVSAGLRARRTAAGGDAVLQAPEGDARELAAVGVQLRPRLRTDRGAGDQKRGIRVAINADHNTNYVKIVTMSWSQPK